MQLFKNVNIQINAWFKGERWGWLPETGPVLRVSCDLSCVAFGAQDPSQMSSPGTAEWFDAILNVSMEVSLLPQVRLHC